MLKTFISILVLVVVGVIILFISQKQSSFKEQEKIHNIRIVNSEVIKKEISGGSETIVAVTLSDGSTKEIARAVVTTPQDDIERIIVYVKSLVSSDGKYIAVQAYGFEESFVQIYSLETNTLHKRTYGDYVRWENGLLHVKACDLSGEECVEKISVSAATPWIFKEKNGVVMGNVMLTEDTDFITNIQKVPELSLFGEMLARVAPEAIKGTGPFTIFAPTNEALQAFTNGKAKDLLLPANKNKIIAIVRNHVISGIYNTVEIQDKSSIKAINNSTITFSSNEWSYIKINNNQAVVTIPNIYSSNGIVHVISGVLRK